MKWRPIVEVPPDLDRIVAFDPEHWYEDETTGRLVDERVCIVSRDPEGWWFEHGHGGYLITPTLFRLVELPEDAPADPRCS